jgi:hypothetical protein
MMNWWKELRAWQQWGIGFASIHFILVGLVLLLSAYNRAFGGSGETGLLILLIDYPIYLLIDSIYPTLIDSRLLLPCLLLFGTIFWACPGIIIGLTLKRRG